MLRTMCIAVLLAAFLSAAVIAGPPNPPGTGLSARINAGAIWVKQPTGEKYIWYPGGYYMNNAWIDAGYTYAGYGLQDYRFGGPQIFDNNRSTTNAFYYPSTNTWRETKWDDPTSPAPLDNYDYAGISQPGEGVYPGQTQVVAIDDDGDGTLELYLHAGYPCWDGQFHRYDPDTGKWKGVGAANHRDYVESGTVESVTTDTLTDSTKSWTPNAFVNTRAPWELYNVTKNQRAVIASNTATTITIQTAGVPGGFVTDISGWAAGDTYEVRHQFLIGTGSGYYAHYLGFTLAYNGWIYVGGGGFWGPDGKSFARYNPVTKKWEELEPTPTAATGSAAGIINGKLYYAGGNQGSAYATAIYVCDLTANPPTWSNTGATLVTGVERPASAVYNGKLYIIGGQISGSADTADIQVYDPTTNSVTVVGQIRDEFGNPVRMSRHAGVIDPDTGDIYVGEGRQYFGDATPPPYGGYCSTKWWKSNVNSLGTWTRIADDPAEWPYNTWFDGLAALQGMVLDANMNGVPDVVVTAKRSGTATSDFEYATKTDLSGMYQIWLPMAPQWKAAAQLPGYKPTSDFSFNTMGGAPIDHDFMVNTDAAGINIAPTGTAYVSSEWPYEPKTNLNDGNTGSTWRTYWLDQPPISGTIRWDRMPDAWAIVDLGKRVSIGAVVINWNWKDYTPVRYTVDVTTDPISPMNPNSASWTTVYTSPLGSNGGFFRQTPWTTDEYSPCYIPLPAGTSATAVRVSMSGAKVGVNCFAMNELQILTAKNSIGYAKLLPDGATVTLIGKTVTAESFTYGSLDANTWYVEEADRSSGIMIQSGDLITIGDGYDIVGTLGTTAGGERYITPTSITQSTGAVIKPLATNTRNLTSDLMDGLWVKVAGKVQNADTLGGTFEVDDGSGTPILVKAGGLTVPNNGTFVSVDGIAGKDGGRIIRAMNIQ